LPLCHRSDALSGNVNCVGRRRPAFPTRRSSDLADAAGRNAGQVQVDLGHVGPGQVIDNDLVRAAAGGEIDLLDAVEVHRDVRDVAGGAHTRAVVGEGAILVHVGPVELHRVGAGL